MPPVPITNCRLAANSAKTRMSVASTSAIFVAGRTAEARPARARRARRSPRGGRAARRASRNSASGVVGGADGAAPIRPYGFATSTMAMTTNSATSVSFGNAIAMAADFDRAERDAQRLGEADQQRGDEGARDRAQAADDGDDERFRDDRRGPCRGWRARAAAAARRRAPRGSDRARTPSVKSARSLTPSALASVRFSVAARDERAEPRSLEQPPEPEQHERPDGEQEQVVGGDRPAEDRRSRRSIPARAGRAGPPRPRRAARRRARSARCRTSRRAAAVPAPRRCASGAAPRSPRR